MPFRSCRCAFSRAGAGGQKRVTDEVATREYSKRRGSTAGPQGRHAHHTRLRRIRERVGACSGQSFFRVGGGCVCIDVDNDNDNDSDSTDSVGSTSRRASTVWNSKRLMGGRRSAIEIAVEIWTGWVAFGLQKRSVPSRGQPRRELDMALADLRHNRVLFADSRWERVCRGRENG